MKFLTEKDLEIFDENIRLENISLQKLKDWRKAYSNAKTDEEKKATRLLSIEAEEARKNWLEHFKAHQKILMLDRLD